MSSDNETGHTYHIGPWRYVWVWIVFGPLAMIYLGFGWFSALPGERAPLLVGGALFLIVPLLVTLLVRTARLEVSERGVRLKQIGYRLEAPWVGITSVRLDRGHEGFITAEPAGGRGAGLLAAAGSGLSAVGLQFYDTEQQALLDEHRLIPIEAFVWHLSHGTLRADIERYAPHLRADLAVLDAPHAQSTRKEVRVSADRSASKPWTLRQWAGMSLIPISLAIGIYLGMSSERMQSLAWQAAGAIFPALFALRTAAGSGLCFRRGSRLAGWGLALTAVLLALWAIGAGFDFAQSLGLDRPVVQAVATLIPVALTLLAAHGARNAFRRHSRLLGAVLSLLTVLLSVWTVVAGLDFAKLWR